MVLSNDQRKILTVFKMEPGEGWLTSAHVAEALGKWGNRAWVANRMPPLDKRGLLERSGDRQWRRITDLGRAALSQASRGETEEG